MLQTNKLFNGALPLAEPHFVEEATLLSARPVVPLQEIRAEERSGKRLVFGVAMACSLMAGALGATLIYKRHGQKQAAAILSAAVPGVGVIAVGPVPAPSLAEIVGGVGAEVVQEPDAPTVVKKSVHWVSHSIESNKAEVRKSMVDQRELRRAERINARRLRRRSEGEAQLESGAGKRKSSGDLFRIRELFEGPSRP